MFPEGNTPLSSDPTSRSLKKINALLVEVAASGGTDPLETAAGTAMRRAADAAAQAELLSETVLVKSANGTLWKLTASNDGTPSLVEQL